MTTARPRRGRLAALLGVALCLGVLSCGVSKPAESTGGGKPTDWSAFGGSHAPVDPGSVRVVPANATEITPVPFVRGVRLSWSNADTVPSWVPENETLVLPSAARQAVLLVATVSSPREVPIRVVWRYRDDVAFEDRLDDVVDGQHYFALVRREDGRLRPLPSGPYLADVFAGDTHVKTVRFEVGQSPGATASQDVQKQEPRP